MSINDLDIAHRKLANDTANELIAQIKEAVDSFKKEKAIDRNAQPLTNFDITLYDDEGFGKVPAAQHQAFAGAVYDLVTHRLGISRESDSSGKLKVENFRLSQHRPRFFDDDEEPGLETKIKMQAPIEMLAKRASKDDPMISVYAKNIVANGSPEKGSVAGQLKTSANVSGKPTATIDGYVRAIYDRDAYLAAIVDETAKRLVASSTNGITATFVDNPTTFKKDIVITAPIQIVQQAMSGKGKA